MPLGAAGQPRHEDRGPLKSLRRVHGRELDRVGLADLAGLQAELLRLGRLEIGQECAERRLLRVARERGRRVGERVKVGPGGSRVAAGP